MSRYSENTEQAMSEQEALSKLLEYLPVKVNMDRLVEYSAYLDGARTAITRFAELFSAPFTNGKDAVINKAVLDLVLSSKRNTHLFLCGTCEMRLRNKVYDKKGKLKSCEAFFAIPHTEYKEVK